MVVNKKLQISFSYNAKYLSEEQIKELQQAYEKKLLEIIAHCTGQEDQSYTASDFDIAEEFADEEDFELLAELYDMEI